MSRNTIPSSRKVLLPVFLAFGLFLGLQPPKRSVGAPTPTATFDRVVLPAGRGPASNAIADVNKDGHLDLLVVSMSDQLLTVLLGDGKGHFRPGPKSPIRTGPGPNDIALGDFNGDGNVDVAIPNTATPNLTLLVGDGSGGFSASPGSPFVTRSQPHVHGVATGDFDGDGKLDVVTDSWVQDSIMLFRGDGEGNLIVPGQLFKVGKRPYERVRTADLNGDGHPDVVTTNLDDNTVSVLLGDGKGGLHSAPGSPFPAGVFPWAIAIDDINHDGYLDFVVLPYDRDIKDPTQLVVTVLLGDGKGGFRRKPGALPSLSGCSGSQRVATGDLNGDGFRDIVVSCGWNNKLMLYYGSQSGSFQTSTLSIQTGWTGVSIADLNGDGKEDILVSNNVLDGEPQPPSGAATILFSR